MGDAQVGQCHHGGADAAGDAGGLVALANHLALAVCGVGPGDLALGIAPLGAWVLSAGRPGASWTAGAIDAGHGLGGPVLHVHRFVDRLLFLVK